MISRPELSQAVKLHDHLPPSLREIGENQSDIPAVAKNSSLLAQIEESVRAVPTRHHLIRGDAREIIGTIEPESAQLVLTSPPYWTLKEYNRVPGQLGYLEDYQLFLAELNRVWETCHRVLVPGGRLICVVGDVCLSRRKNQGRHMVMPLHASIQESCREIGFDNLAPIIWHKIANASFEATGNGSSFLGKPYEPNSVIKNDIEFILMQRKPGGYRKPSMAARLLSVIAAEDHKQWFQQIWSGLTGASTRSHPAPYPLTLATRLIRMFSFVGDVVVDPFAGTGTTTLAAAKTGRNSLSVEIDPAYLSLAEERIEAELGGLFRTATLNVIREHSRGISGIAKPQITSRCKTG